MHSVRSRGRRHRKRRLVRELGGSRQGNRRPWWFSPDDRDWLCSPDRSRRCVSLHMLVTAAEFLLGPSHPTGLAPRRLKCADPATYQGQRGSESLRPRLGTVLRGTSRREDGRDPSGPMDSAAALEGARRYLSGLQPEDHHGDGVAQPPYRVANPWGQGYDREPRAGASELPSTDPQPRVRCGKAASCEGRSRGLSCMKGNFHVQFLGEGVAATSPPYPTLGGRPPRSTRPGLRCKVRKQRPALVNPLATAPRRPPSSML